MSRSIHTTRRSIDKIFQEEYATPEAKLDAFDKAHKQMRRKRLIKRQVKAERKETPPPLQGTAISTIPIEVLDEGPFVHHGASPEDLRAVLASLPQAASEGISRIQLGLGTEYLEEQNEAPEKERDPYVGRVSSEMLPGVYSGDMLGTFDPKNGVISVFAFVYDPDRLPLPQKACELYLRLHALSTFVHEVAHHHDEAQRVRRGRWLADETTKVEGYARTMQGKWTRTVIIPYLERAYPAEVAELINWLEGWVGVRLPMEYFTDNAKYYYIFSSSFENWMGKMPKYETRTQARFAFAEAIHLTDRYETCLQILESLLKETPEDVSALALKADTLVHLQRYDEAFVTAQRVLELDAKNWDAWESCAEVMIARRDWNTLLETCSRWESSGAPDDSHSHSIPWYRTIAYCGLENRPDMEKTFDQFWTLYRYKPKSSEAAARRKKTKWKAIYRRAGKPLPADLAGRDKK